MSRSECRDIHGSSRVRPRNYKRQLPRDSSSRSRCENDKIQL